MPVGYKEEGFPVGYAYDRFANLITTLFVGFLKSMILKLTSHIPPISHYKFHHNHKTPQNLKTNPKTPIWTTFYKTNKNKKKPTNLIIKIQKPTTPKYSLSIRPKTLYPDWESP